MRPVEGVKVQGVSDEPGAVYVDLKNGTSLRVPDRAFASDGERTRFVAVVSKLAGVTPSFDVPP